MKIRQNRKSEQQRAEQRQADDAGHVRHAECGLLPCPLATAGRKGCPAQHQAQRGAKRNHDKLRVDGRQRAKHGDAEYRDACALPVWTELARHVPHGLRHHSNGNQLQTVDQARAKRAAEARREHRKCQQQQDGRQRKAAPRRQPAAPAGPEQADGKPDLAAGRPRQKLAQPDQIGECCVVQPTAALHELAAEVADMRDRAAEAREAQLEKDRQHFHGRARLMCTERCGGSGHWRGISTFEKPVLEHCRHGLEGN